MAGIDVRRLAAADMWGARGTIRRRRVILAEFVLGAVGCTVLGVVALVAASSWVWILIGAWLVGIGVNYVPLALHAVALSRHGALEAELHDVQPNAALRTATVQQVWIFVPFAVAVAATAEARR